MRNSFLFVLVLAFTPFGVGAEFVSWPTRAAAVESAQKWTREKTGWRAWTTVRGTGSMRPVLNGGEIILLERITWPARKGELLVYQGDGLTILHRVYQDNGRAVFMTGDNNSRSDGWILRPRFLWRVIRVHTWAK